jgi:uncharacterized protein (TIGR03083 family)
LRGSEVLPHNELEDVGDRLASATVTDLLTEAYDGISQVVIDLDDTDLHRPSRCRGWSVADVVFHLLLDAQRALVTFASPATGTPDVDAVTYWAPHKPGASWAAAHEEFVRASTAAHSGPRVVVHRWVETAAAATRAAASATPTDLVRTQDHILTVSDFTSTLVVEAVLHHLDLTVDLPAAPAPSPAVLTHAREVFDGILGATAPATWTRVDYALAAGGRAEVPPDVAGSLGDAATRFPLLG